MNFLFPEKTRNSLPNMIREVNQDGAAIPNFISLAVGNPALEVIPVEAIQKAAGDVFTNHPLACVQYGSLLGDPELREYTTKRLVEVRDFPEKDQNIIMMSGAGQGIGLVPRAICCDGDEVYVDEFAFTNTLNAIRSSGCKMIPIHMDEDGMLPDELERAASSGKGRYICLNPNFQNPTGITMSLKRRQEVYEIAQKYDLLIFEDDPYGEIRFRGKHVPCFKSIDPDGRVLHNGSYSKTLSPGLRVGFLYGDNKLIKTLQLVKNSTDGQGPLVGQMIAMHTLRSMDFEAHIAKTCSLYLKKANLMVSTLKQYCPNTVKIREPEGGMFVWVTIPETVDIDEVYRACIQVGVGAVRSLAFAADLEHPGHSFRLNYTFPDEDRIIDACTIFGKTLSRYC